MTQQITVEIDVEGDVKVAVSGVKGSGCQALTSAIEQAIGKTTSDDQTPEFHQHGTRTVPQQASASQ
jgi:hypothetical protein